MLGEAEIDATQRSHQARPAVALKMTVAQHSLLRPVREELPQTALSTVTPCVSVGAFWANLKYNPLRRMERNKWALLS